MTLLWTNPAPASSFAAQTVALDLSGYKAIVVVAQDHPSRPDLTSVFCPIGGGQYLVLCPYADSKLYNFSCRRITPDATGVFFGSGVNESGLENSNAVPIYIYGIK